MEVLINITRDYQVYQTIGEVEVYCAGELEFIAKSLELPNHMIGDEYLLSIAPGEYKVSICHSKKYGRHLVVHLPYSDIDPFICFSEDKDTTLLNYNILDGILIGKDWVDHNNNCVLDLTQSRETFNYMMNVINNEDNITLKIN